MLLGILRQRKVTEKTVRDTLFSTTHTVSQSPFRRQRLCVSRSKQTAAHSLKPSFPINKTYSFFALTLIPNSFPYTLHSLHSFFTGFHQTFTVSPFILYRFYPDSLQVLYSNFLQSTHSLYRHLECLRLFMTVTVL